MTPTGPDFLVVGAQRSGTTWLHRLLQRHPELWLPPIKELHYFDNLAATRNWLDPKERRRWGRKLRPRALLLDPWERRFWFGRRSDAWYMDLFRKAQARGLIAGEITPAYASLDEEVLRRIRDMNPRIKLAFIMRDPLDRAWSAVNNAKKKGRFGTGLTLDAALAKVRSPRFAARSAYTDTIKRLEKVFSPNQLHLCFFDELRDAPENLARRLFLFLGAEAGDVQPYLPPQAVNASSAKQPMPDDFAREVVRDYYPMVRDLCARFDGPPQRWLSRYEALLCRT